MSNPTCYQAEMKDDGIEAIINFKGISYKLKSEAKSGGAFKEVPFSESDPVKHFEKLQIGVKYDPVHNELILTYDGNENKTNVTQKNGRSI